MPAEGRVYIATMQICDGESAARVSRHRAQRADMKFRTIECPIDLAGADIDDGNTVLLEDLPNLLANEMFDGGDPGRIVPALRALAVTCRNLVIVTNDVFSDGVVYSDATLDYLQKLAAINREAAKLADYVAEVVCSIPIPLKGETPCV